MLETYKKKQSATSPIVNWQIGSDPTVLESIHQHDINIAIYERDTTSLKKEIEQLIQKEIVFKSQGSINKIIADLKNEIGEKEFQLITKDIKALLEQFSNVTKGNEFLVLLKIVNSNMCRKFHTDINDIRMLCTYSGPGTLWLTDDNINHRNLGLNQSIVIDEEKIQQVQTGAVALLKGALYPKDRTKSVVHRSPSIEENGNLRLILRIDTNENLNLWK